MKILNKKHPKFKEFILRLQTACSFCGDKEIDESCNFNWNCNDDYRRCKELLKDYEDVDIEKTLKYFESKGGFCDCEVYFNVP